MGEDLQREQAGVMARWPAIFAAGLFAGVVVAVAARGGPPSDAQAPASPQVASVSAPSVASVAPPVDAPKTPTAPPIPRGGAPDPTRVTAHLRVAPDLWARVVDAARSSERARPLLAELEAHVAALPSPARDVPPAAVDAYLTQSRALLDRVNAAGVDAAELSVTIDALRRPGFAGPNTPAVPTNTPPDASAP
jgi:hypothetical protein